MRPRHTPWPWVLALLAIAASGAGAAAQDVTVRAYVEPSGRITDSQTLRLVIEAEGQEVDALSVPRLPSLKNLKLVGGPSTSQSSVFQFDGGQSRQVVTRQLIYTLVPEGPGPAEVPPVDVQIGSTTRTTEAIRFEVTAGATGRPPDVADRPRSDDESVPVFLQADLGTAEAWVGEAVNLDVTLFAGMRITGLSFLDEPSFANFWVEDDPPDARAESFRTTVSGRLYNAYPVVRKILVPTTPGEFTLTPYSAEVDVARSGGDPFRDFFNARRSVSVVRRTEPLRLRIRGLPEPEDDIDFTGAVGSFRLDTRLDRETARVNDAVGVVAVVEGEGFLRSVPAPKLEGNADIKVFEPKVTERSEIRRGKLVSRKRWEWIVVPLAPGEVRVPAVRFDYFDPEAGRYQRLSGPDRSLIVQRGDLPADEIAASGEVRLQRRDIAFIKPLRDGLADAAPRVHQRGWYLALIVAPFVLAPLLIVAERQRVRYLRDHGLARARRARSRARKRLGGLRRRADRIAGAGFHEEVARAVIEYLADRFDRSPSGLTYDVADDLLSNRGVDADLRRRVRSCLETCDFARYVSSAGQEEGREEIRNEAAELVDHLERALS